MKKLVLLSMVAMLLAGCGAQPVFETLGAVPAQAETVAAQQMLVQLPGDMLTPALQSEDTGTLYICDEFTMSLITLPGGDLERTVRTCTGFSQESLTLMRHGDDTVKRYDLAWSAAGEGALQTCRGVILDDGNYHYVLTVMADAALAGDLADKWQYIFDTFRLSGQPTPVNIGS